MTPLLELRNVSKTYGGELFSRQGTTVALDNLTFSIADDASSIITVAGESGSGKTTLASILLGQLAPTSGQVLYRGRDVATMSNAERKQFRREVQPIFQDPFAAFNPFYRIDHVLSVPIARFRLASSAQQARHLMEESLELVGLRPQDTLGRFPHQLSGGQRQRIMIARALLCRPRVILADEPVSMVDASLRATILSSLQRVNRDLGITVVYITHDLTTAYQISDNIVILYRGSVAEAGSVERAIREPKHPYTQLLVSSVPLITRQQGWTDVAPSDTEENDRASRGCKFAPRCPSVMERCWSSAPPLYRLDADRLASCFVYDDCDVFEQADVAQIFPQRELIDR